MRIALCLQYPLGLRGGVSVLVETLLREFAARGHQIVLVSSDREDDLRKLKVAESIHQHIYFDEEKISRTVGKKLARQIADAKVDLAHFHSGGAFVWGRLPFQGPVSYLDRLGVPCFSTVHLVIALTEGYCGPQRPIWFKLLALPPVWCAKMQQLWHTRREIAVSQHDFQKLRRWYWPLKNRFVQIYHSQLPATAPVPLPQREKIILNVGHIAWRKGQAVLAEAFAQIAGRHPEWTLQLAGYGGDGVSVEQIHRIAKEHHLEQRIRLLGERADAFELMRRAAIYVQPSFWEALGLALQEAMFCGCACIGSRAGGIPELICENETGLLFEPGNVAQLAAALEQLITDEKRREQFGRLANASIGRQGMTVERMVARHLELYETARRS